jgi:hypothetical protein
MVDRLRVTRNQLAAFISDFETIKQFERLIGLVDSFSASEIDEEGNASASARATQALTLINDLSQRLGLEGDARATQALTLINDLSQRLGVLQGAPTQPQDASTAVDYIDFRPLAPHAQRIRRLAWSDTDQTLEVGMDYGVLQQVGMNVYARVENSTGSTISRGEVVGFAGVGPGGVLSVAPYLADGSTPSLYILGVMAHDLPNAGEIGYCTVWGHVLGIDTSAFSVGDVLYASPSSAGGFTATKPTAPNNVIPTAAVLIDDATAGQIFVRPTIEQQKYYGEFTKTTSQSPAATNTAYALTFDNTEIAGGVVIGVTTSQIIVPESGLYQFDTTIQISSSNSSDKNVWVWFRKNGANIANSARIVTINTNGGYVPVTLIEFFSLAANDYIEIMFAANATAVAITSVAATAFAPAAPAVVLAVTQIQQ